MLLGGEHGEHLGELGDLNDWLVRFESAWHGYLQILLREQLRRHVSQLVELNFLLFGGDFAEYGVVDVPCLVYISHALSDLVALHPAEGFLEVAGVPLVKGDLVHCLRFFLHNGMIWLYVCIHGLAVIASEVDATGLLDRLLPGFSEKDGGAIELV